MAALATLMLPDAKAQTTREAFRVEESEARTFASQMVDALSYCGGKRRAWPAGRSFKQP